MGVAETYVPSATALPCEDDEDDRWREVFSELVRRARSDAEFRSRVEATGAVIDDFDAVLQRSRAARTPASGAIECKAYWWGFQLEIPRATLAGWQDHTAAKAIVTTLETSFGPVAAFRRRVAAWVANRLDELQQLDQGNGVYTSMTWMAPNIFVAMPIRAR